MGKIKAFIRNYITKGKLFVSQNRNEVIILGLILLIGAFLRLYKIDQYMTFLGDEGRDVTTVRRLLVNFDLILIGPGTSIGNMYLGPIYYYMMAPALFLANFSPVGPAVMIALLGIITIFFVWFIAREWFGIKAAVIASLLYTIAPTVIIYSRSSWNPNIMPFFALLTIYSAWRLWRKLELKWLLVIGVSMSFVLQSHYLGLLLVPVVGLLWIFTFIKVRVSKKEYKPFIKETVYAILIFLILMSPLVIFDARHGWRNFTAMKEFFAVRQTTVSIKPWSGLSKIPEIASQTTGSLIGSKDVNLTWLYDYGILFVFLWLTIKYLFSEKKINIKNKKYWKYLWGRLKSDYFAPYLLLFLWIGFAYVGLSLYKQHIYDHYFGFFFPAPFLLAGGLSQYIYENFSKFWKALLTAFLIYAVFVNLSNDPLKYPPNRQLQRSEDVAKAIIKEAGSQKFNLAVIAQQNYEGAYQYFLERWNAPIVMIDPQRADQTIAGQLYVVCELPQDQCDPTHNPKAQVANFGWSKVSGEWQIDGVTLFKLVHTKK